MNFWMTVLAVFTGIFLDKFLGCVYEEIRKKAAARKREQQTKIGFQDKNEKKRDTYSPEVSGRRSIGFKMQDEQ